MQIQINPGHVEATLAIEQHIISEVEKALDHHREQITRVEVHLHDENGPKSGIDKRCLMEIRIGGLPPLVVEANGDDLYLAITAAARKAVNAVEHKLGKLQNRRG